MSVQLHTFPFVRIDKASFTRRLFKDRVLLRGSQTPRVCKQLASTSLPPLREQVNIEMRIIVLLSLVDREMREKTNGVERILGRN